MSNTVHIVMTSNMELSSVITNHGTYLFTNPLKLPAGGSVTVSPERGEARAYDVDNELVDEVPLLMNEDEKMDPFENDADMPKQAQRGRVRRYLPPPPGYPHYQVPRNRFFEEGDDSDEGRKRPVEVHLASLSDTVVNLDDRLTVLRANLSTVLTPEDPNTISEGMMAEEKDPNRRMPQSVIAEAILQQTDQVRRLTRFVDSLIMQLEV